MASIQSEQIKREEGWMSPFISSGATVSSYPRLVKSQNITSESIRAHHLLVGMAEVSIINHRSSIIDHLSSII